MVRPKLPPYETLKQLVLDEGLSYAAVAERFNAHHDSVYQKLKYGAEKNGEPWPLLPTNRSETIRAGLLETTIPSEGIAFVIEDAYQQELAKRVSFDMNETVAVPLTAINKSAPHGNFKWRTNQRGEPFINSRREVWPRRLAIYHRPTCVYAKNYECVEMTLSEAEDWAFARCSFCFDYTLSQWAGDNGFPRSYILGIVEGRIPRIRIANAKKILRKIGEPVPRRMEAWKPRSVRFDHRPSRNSRNSRLKAKKAA